MFGGRTQDKKFVAKIIAAACSKPFLTIVDDKYGSPTYTADMSRGMLNLIKTGWYGTYHMVGTGGYCNRLEYAQAILDYAGVRSCELRPVSSAAFPLSAPRPVLGTMKAIAEMALPIKVENRIIGVLHVQNDRPQAIDENAITVMQILADQLATAIERRRLLQQVEQNLSELEQAYGQFTRAGWRTFKETGLLSKAGYRFDNVRIQPITGVSPLGDEALKVGATLMNKPQDDPTAINQVAIPIKLRGQTIGVVTANLKEDYTQTTISSLELAIERLALSLESARLYEEARLRPDREQAVAQTSTNIGSSSEFDAILRTTVEEIGRSVGGSEVSIQIVSDTETQDQ